MSGKALLACARARNTELALFFIKEGAQHFYYSTDDPYGGWSPLHWAAYHGDTKLLTALINAGHDTTHQDRYHNTPIQVAVKYDQWQAVKTIAKTKTSNGLDKAHYGSALLAAVRNDDTETALVLIKQTRGRLTTAWGSTDDPYKCWTTLHWAASHGNTELLTALINAGHDTTRQDSYGKTPIEVAVKYKQWQAVQTIAKTKTGDRLDEDHYGSALLSAVRNNDTETALVLIEKTPKQLATVWRSNDYPYEGWTTLHWAARYDNRSLMRALIAAGHLLYQKDNYGDTCAQVQARYRQERSASCVDLINYLKSTFRPDHQDFQNRLADLVKMLKFAQEGKLKSYSPITFHKWGRSSTYQTARDRLLTAFERIDSKILYSRFMKLCKNENPSLFASLTAKLSDNLVDDSNNPVSTTVGDKNRTETGSPRSWAASITLGIGTKRPSRVDDSTLHEVEMSAMPTVS